MHWLDRNEHWHSCHSRGARGGATIPGMKIEILLFDGFDDLDAFGPFEVLTGAGLDTRFVTIEPRETVRSSHGATIVPEGVLGDPDLVLVPGGGWNDRETRRRLPRGAARRDPGGAAPPPRGGRADRLGLHRRDDAGRGGHPEGPPGDHAPQRDRGPQGFGADVQDGARFVDDGDIITAAGVTSGIDLALHLVAQRARRGGGACRGGRDRVDQAVSTPA